MRIADALREWDDWCIRTRHARWRVSKYARPPDRDRAVAAQLNDAMDAGARRLGVPASHLWEAVIRWRRAGLDHEDAVAAARRDLA